MSSHLGLQGHPGPRGQPGPKGSKGEEVRGKLRRKEGERQEWRQGWEGTKPLPHALWPVLLGLKEGTACWRSARGIRAQGPGSGARNRQPSVCHHMLQGQRSWRRVPKATGPLSPAMGPDKCPPSYAHLLTPCGGDTVQSLVSKERIGNTGPSAVQGQPWLTSQMALTLGSWATMLGP